MTPRRLVVAVVVAAAAVRWMPDCSRCWQASCCGASGRCGGSSFVPDMDRPLMTRIASGSTRRAFMTSALALAAASRLARAAAATPLVVPEVDSLALQVLVDAAVFGPFLNDFERPGMKVEYV